MIKVGDKIQTKENFKYLVPNSNPEKQLNIRADYLFTGFVYIIQYSIYCYQEEIDLYDIQLEKKYNNSQFPLSFICISFTNSDGAQIPLSNWERYIQII